MGAAKRRRDHIAALLNTPAQGEPRELMPREAAGMLVEARHIVAIAPFDTDAAGHKLLRMLGTVLGESMGYLAITPAYDPNQRPNVRAYAPHLPGKQYPPLLVAFFPDTRAHRALFDELAAGLGAPAYAQVSPHPERGPIVFAMNEMSEGAILVVNTLRDLHHGDADDLSLN